MLGQRRRGLGEHAGGERHALAHHHQDGVAARDHHRIRHELTLDARHHAVLGRLRELVAADHHGDRVDAAGKMLVGDMLVLKDVQQLVREANLAVHAVLVDDDVAEAVRRRNAGHRAGDHAARLHDHRARLVRMIRVAHVDRDARLHRREDRLVVEHAEACVGQLAHLAVGHRVDALLHLRNDARIDGIDIVHVGEVLIDVGADRRRQDGAGDVRSAARERGDRAVLAVTEEAGIHHDALEIGERLGELAVGLRIERGVAALALKDHARLARTGIARLRAALDERRRNDLRGVVLARRLQRIHEHARVSLGGGHAGLEILLDLLDDLIAELEVLGDGRVAVENRLEGLGRLLLRKRRLRERDQQIRHLRVGLVSFAGRAHHDHAPRGIREHYVKNLRNLPRIRETRSAEFAYLHLLVPLLKAKTGANYTIFARGASVRST